MGREGEARAEKGRDHHVTWGPVGHGEDFGFYSEGTGSHGRILSRGGT